MSEDHFRVERWRRGRNKTEMFADTLIEWLGLGTNYAADLAIELLIYEWAEQKHVIREQEHVYGELQKPQQLNADSPWI